MLICKMGQLPLTLSRTKRRRKSGLLLPPTPPCSPCTQPDLLLALPPSFQEAGRAAKPTEEFAASGSGSALWNQQPFVSSWGPFQRGLSPLSAPRPPPPPPLASQQPYGESLRPLQAAPHPCNVPQRGAPGALSSGWRLRWGGGVEGTCRMGAGWLCTGRRPGSGKGQRLAGGDGSQGRVSLLGHLLGGGGGGKGQKRPRGAAQDLSRD